MRNQGNYTAYQQYKTTVLSKLYTWSGFAEQNAKTIYPKSKEINNFKIKRIKKTEKCR
jgi:hypothetical protein